MVIDPGDMGRLDGKSVPSEGKNQRSKEAHYLWVAGGLSVKDDN